MDEFPDLKIDRRGLMKFGAATAGLVAGDRLVRTTGAAKSLTPSGSYLAVNLAGTGPGLATSQGPILSTPSRNALGWQQETDRLLALGADVESFCLAPVDVSYLTESGKERPFSLDEFDMPSDAFDRFFDGSDEFSRQIAVATSTLLARGDSDFVDLGFIFPGDLHDGERIIAPMEPAPAGFGVTPAIPQWQIRQRIGDYQIRLSLKKAYLPSCIKRTGWYVGCEIQKFYGGSRGKQIFNLHLMSWWTWRGPCFGVWESIRTGYCKTWCTWNLWKVIAGAAAAVLSYYVTGWAVGALSNVIAGATLGGLTLAPGIPPPP